MIQVLEYIKENYTLFFAGIILILLAFIGYYADKTNFGQGKNTNLDNNNKKDLDHMRLSEVTGQNKVDKPEETLKDEAVEVEQSNTISANPEKGDVTTNGIEPQQSVKANNVPVVSMASTNADLVQNDLIEEASKDVVDTPVESIDNDQKNDDNNVSNGTEVAVVAEKTDDSLLNEDVFNKFNEEFNLLMPEKELINTDLLSDIDDLELGRTQKLDLSEIPDLDDIELPKIKQLSQEEQDIWKF